MRDDAGPMSLRQKLPLDFGDKRSMPYSYEPPAYNVILISGDQTLRLQQADPVQAGSDPGGRSHIARHA